MNLMTVFFLQAPAAGPDGSMMLWIMLIAMFAIMYFFMIRPPKLKSKKKIVEFRQISSSEPKGDYCRWHSWYYQGN